MLGFAPIIDVYVEFAAYRIGGDFRRSRALTCCGSVDSKRKLRMAARTVSILA